MPSALANYSGLNLGPRSSGAGILVPLNLGVRWDSNPPEPVLRGVRASSALPWASYSSISTVHSTRWGGSAREHHESAIQWSSIAIATRRATVARWGFALQSLIASSCSWRTEMVSRRAAADSGWNELDDSRGVVTLKWAAQRTIPSSRLLGWRSPERARRDPHLEWMATRFILGLMGRVPWRNLGVSRRAAGLPWGDASRVPWVVSDFVEPPDPDAPSPFPPGNLVALNLGCSAINSFGRAPLNLGAIACYATRPKKGTYIVLNTISVVRLPDRAPVEVESVSIDGSIGAWGYDVDMTLADPAHLALLRPAADGRREVEITINGYVWTAIIESYSHRREFVRRGVTVTGRSRTALLAAPYAPARALVSSQERSMAQLAAGQLADSGYTVDWDTVDWQVPAGVWYYDGMTPMDAVSTLAEAAGAVVQSDPATRHLRVVPRYPVSPWAWPDTSPDHVVQDDIITAESGQVRSAPVYNAVVVTGELAGAGVTARVVRQGEAGDLYAPQASSPLITVAAAAAERGRNILSDRGDQDDIDLTLPMFPAPVAAGSIGRVSPMQLIEVRGSTGTWHGQCTATRVDARVSGNAITVEQTITLERHYTDAN